MCSCDGDCVCGRPLQANSEARKRKEERETPSCPAAAHSGIYSPSEGLKYCLSCAQEMVLVIMEPLNV